MGSKRVTKGDLIFIREHFFFTSNVPDRDSCFRVVPLDSRFFSRVGGFHSSIHNRTRP